MATILGDAKIKLSLDVEAAKAELEKLAQQGSEVKDRTDVERERQEKAKAPAKGIHTSKNAPLQQAFKLARAQAYGNPALTNAPPLTPGMNPAVIRARQHASQAAVAQLRSKHGLPPAGQSAAAAFMQNMSAGRALIMGAQAYVAAKAVKAVIDAVQASPKATMFAKTLAPGAATDAVDAFASHLSDTVIGLKAKFESFGKAAADEKALAAAALRLGQNVPLGGAVDLFHWLQNQNEREEKMRLRVDREFDREVMAAVAKNIRPSVHR